jgi:hypothetical protein
MPMTFTIEPGDDAAFLHTVVRGAFDIDEAQQLFLMLLEIIVRNRASRVLFDGQEITGEPTTIERFYYGKFAAAAVTISRNRETKINPRFAYVLKHPVLDPMRFGEIVAVNRGMNLKAFDNIEAARRWLELPRKD